MIERRRPLAFILYVGVWTLPGLISASQLFLGYALRGDSPAPGLILGLTLPGWYLWAALAPVVFLTVRRFPLEGGRLFVRVPLHLLVNALLTGIWVAAMIGLRALLGLPGSTAVAPVAVSAIGTNLLTYWTLVLIAHALRYRREREAKTRRESELSAQLSDARLSALKAQLHPHFLFNTLNAISAFVSAEPDRAEAMLANLGELLRELLEDSGDPIVPLSRELDFVERYLAIQKARLGDRLRIGRSVDDAAKSCGVPSMLLQPLVENAVEHGIAKRRGGGMLRLSAVRTGNRLRLEVSDDGPGASAEALDPTGWRVGLGNTRDRLRHLFGDDHEFAVSNGTEGGVCAVVILPVVAVAEEP